MIERITALAGGVGGAKLVLGFSNIHPASSLSVIVNTGDDSIFHGLYVCPDLDTVMYTLSGLSDPVTGWGIAGDTRTVLNQLHIYGQPTWFTLGDKDIATHICRTEMLNSGYTLSEVTVFLAKRLGVAVNLFPMSDSIIQTKVATEAGLLNLEDYFVRLKTQPVVKNVQFEGAETAQMSYGFIDALQNGELLVFCPSNPIISINPILAVDGARAAIKNFRGLRVAVSPIIGGKAVRGPAAKMMEELGYESSALTVAQMYQDLCDVFVIDNVDQSYEQLIQELGLKVLCTNTIMVELEDKIRLAQEILDYANSA